MTSYRFHLQKYRTGSKTDCPSCKRKRCFTRYIDEENRIIFPDFVGKCDHQNSCGYHFTPKEYFKEHPMKKEMDAPFFHKYTPQPMHPVSPSYIDPQIMQRSLTAYHKNPLYLYVKKLFGEESAHRLFLLYNVGTSSKWNGSTVYWQVDREGRVHTGKVMRYDAQTGHRVKEPHGYVSWAHAELQLKDFHLQQCLFGEHLLSHLSVVLIKSHSGRK